MNEIYSGYNITLNKEENRAYKGKMLKIEGNSKQETRSGRNKADLSGVNKSQVSVSYVSNEDGSIKVSGTASADGYIMLKTLAINIPSETYVTMAYGSTKELLKDTDIKAFVWFYDASDNLVGSFNSSTVTMKDKYPTDIVKMTIGVEHMKSGVTYNLDLYIDIEVSETIPTEYEQYGASPSIDYPSEVESVGDNINLIDIDSLVEGYVKDGGECSTSTQYGEMRSDFLKVKPNTQYTFKIHETSGKEVSWIGIAEYSSSEISSYILRNVYSPNKYIENASYTITTSNTTQYVIVSARNLIGATKIKFEKGTKATPYSPYGQGSIEIKQSAKNLANYTNNTTEKNFNIGDVKIGKTYSLYLNINGFISFNLRYGSSSGTLIFTKYSVSEKRVYTFTATENGVLYFNGFTSDAGAFVSVDEIMLIEGEYTIDTIPTYEKYQGKIKALYTQQPFRAIGDVKDRFVKKMGKWHEEHKNLRYIFTGNEGWKKSSRTDVNRYYVDNIINTILNASTVDILCSHFKALTPSQSDIAMTGISKYNEKGLMVNVDLTNTELDTVDKFKAKLTELYNAGTPVYVDYVLATPTLIPCTPQQSTILDQLENIQLYDGVNYIYTTNGIQPLLTLELYNMIEDYDLYVSNDGYFGIPGTDIKFLVNFYESNLPTMPEAVEASVRAAGRNGDYVLNTTYEPLPFEIVCFTEDNLTPTQKKEIESKVNRFLNSIKNRTKKIAFEKGEKFYNVKYNGLLTTTNYPAHLKFSIPLKSSESFGKDAYQKVLSGNSTEVSDTVEEVGALITINGPATLPIIALNDYSMEYSTSILEGARIEIDTAKSTATHINSDGVKTNVMRYYNHQFPKIQPGENTLKVLSGVDDENNVTVKWNDLKL